MNEVELKNKFMDFLLSNNKNVFTKNDTTSTSKIFEIKNEGLNRKFDLIIGLVKSDKTRFKQIKKETIEIDENLKSIFFRNVLLKSISEKYKIKIHNLIIYPVELKSDKDKLDQRLANQIIDAILIFGRSVVVLDESHANKIKKSGFYKIIPSTILGYLNEQDLFVLIQEYDRLISDSLLNINKSNLIRTLEKSDKSDKSDKSRININYNNLYSNLKIIQNINQKLIYNQIFNYDNVLFDNELEFIKNFSNMKQNISFKKEITKLIKESKNYKITEFIN